ncbi:DUF3883 domain-containing protein [uncultured Luteimonas sp.]|uniref:DUF3883 domain-containing protein n=1 Tax=uncultured Luteimonas sp. TaxID=453144 RepID=UPI002604ECB7|nr:DUF3883 domain-containing protein [uncultured Luteimonas sp.]
MATGEDWSRLEVEACVADYLHMLELELNGQQFNKSARIQALMQKLDGRSKASVEYKFRNISAVMQELQWPTVSGYKALENYQLLLLEVVEAQLRHRPALQVAAEHAVTRPAAVAETVIVEQVWIPKPKPKRLKEAPPQYAPRFSPARRDYLARESHNRSLGRAGELFVMELEAQRLHAAGRKVLAERVEQVSETQGDGLGFDVLSFETDGRERLIEVKTTAFGELTPFFVSRNELARSSTDAERYQLYRVFDFRRRPRVFNLPGAIEGHCQLDATTFLAQLAD